MFIVIGQSNNSEEMFTNKEKAFITPKNILLKTDIIR